MFRAVIIYCTYLCRFDKFSRWTDNNFLDMGNLACHFLAAESDQFVDNLQSVIPERLDSPACQFVVQHYH